MNIEIIVDTRPNLRDREMTVFVGQFFLKQLFDTNDDLTETKDIVLEFPERWLNILELRALLTAIKTRCPKVENLTILTANEHLLTTCRQEQIKILLGAENYPEVPYSEGVRYCPLPEPKGLQIF